MPTENTLYKLNCDCGGKECGNGRTAAMVLVFAQDWTAGFNFANEVEAFIRERGKTFATVSFDDPRDIVGAFARIEDNIKEESEKPRPPEDDIIEQIFEMRRAMLGGEYKFPGQVQEL